MFNQLHGRLVRLAPSLLRAPARWMPFALQQKLMGALLSQIFSDALADGDFAFLQDRWLRIEVRDLQLGWFISSSEAGLIIAEQAPQADVTFSAELNDLILIAGRKEDPDSLFFQRRLRIEGDTELGLEVKNLMDSIDLAVLPSVLRYALQDFSGFVQRGLAQPMASERAL